MWGLPILEGKTPAKNRRREFGRRNKLGKGGDEFGRNQFEKGKRKRKGRAKKENGDNQSEVVPQAPPFANLGEGAALAQVPPSIALDGGLMDLAKTAK